MLGRHSLAADLEQVDREDGRSTGEILLAKAAAQGAGLLVLGAYGHARLREFIVGGATHQVMREATLPVLVSG